MSSSMVDRTQSTNELTNQPHEQNILIEEGSSFKTLQPLFGRTPDSCSERVAGSIPGRGAAEEFSPPELTFCADSYSRLFHLHVTTVTHRSWSGLTMLCWHSVGTY